VSPIELSEEARALIADVERLEERAQRARDEIAQLAESARESFARERAEIERDRELLDALLEKRSQAHELIASAWADWEIARGEITAEWLETKAHPALTAAENVRAKTRELAVLRREAKLAQQTVELYEWHFPWLAELRDIGEGEAYVAKAAEELPSERKDPVSDWLTAEEFRALPSAERNQRALERYLKSRKSPWQLGRDYERYIGYLREQAGAEVTYHGIFKGFEDLGRDVLAERDAELEMIQCKRWAQHKTIHEKHVFQLYGTVVLARLEHPEKRVTGTFTTTTRLSPKAREVAEYLEIKIEEEVPLADYPRIKCNISQRDGERIYHLPFDQQYDTTVIDPARGERYVATAQEAEELGFRRAWRWRVGRESTGRG
jgi:hypothetical protein